MESTLHSARRPVSAALPGLGRQSDVHVYFAAVLGYLLLMPPQLNATIAGSTIPPYRFFLLFASIYVLATASRGRLRPAWPDLFIALTIGWICLAMSMTSSTQQALTASVAHICDIGLAYFFARAAFRNMRDFRMFMLLLLPGLLLTAITIAIESVTFTHIIQGTMSKLTGRPFIYRADPRMGLMRAQGPFPHPISAGIFLVSFLPLYWLAGFKGWIKIAGAVAALGSFFSVSSVALLGLSVSSALLIYNWITSLVANVTWRLFFIISAIVLFVTELGTKAGAFNLLMRFGSLNSDSSYMRVHIWNYGSRNVEKNPWFGLGYGDWARAEWMTDSIDNYWLAMAIRFGLLPTLLIGLAIFSAVVLILSKSMRSSGSDQQTERGLAISLSVFALGLISVAVWLSTQVWLYMLLGLTVSLATAPAQARGPAFRPVRRVPSTPAPVAA